MPEHRLSILHISDLHARSMEVDDLPAALREQRRQEVHREAAGRARVLGEAWRENLRAMYPKGERPDLVCITGDVADWGLTSEYAKATELVDELVRVLGIERSRVYVVPGNHDVQRTVSKAEWEQMRELLSTEARATSKWLAGGKPPRAVEAGVADAVMRRTAAFWQWVEHGLGQPELLPGRHPHRRLGYHHVAALPKLPFEVHVIGLDSAWLCGDEHDQGKLWLTEHQRDMLLHDEHGHAWKGFRLALVHHPLEELAQPDIGPSRRGLASAADLLLHGHQHDPVGSSLVDLDGNVLRVLAAGCLYEGTEGSAWKNGCQRIDVVLDDAGRPQRAEIHFRAWSSHGHWHSDSSLYREARDGRLSWEAWGSSLLETENGEPRKRTALKATAATSDALAARLEDAYSRRNELTSLGEDTSDVDADILKLRREQRQGPTLRAGEFLGDGRFRLVKVIGHGGFATVWKAHDRSTGQAVAIKVLHGQFADAASRRERLFRGAKRMARLKHPNVVRVLVPEGEEHGFHYYVMEHVTGGDLHQAVLERRISHEQALDVIESIADALEAAHGQGLVHRDVKPQNILLRENGEPALTDFDLVYAKDTTGGTRTGALGTVLYAAPEQAEDASTVDHRADIYSLGMTAIFCVHGKSIPQSAMFDRESFLSRLTCAKATRNVLRRATALEPGDRFETMANFRAALAMARASSRTTSRTDVELQHDGSLRVEVEKRFFRRIVLIIGAVVGTTALSWWGLTRLRKWTPDEASSASLDAGARSEAIVTPRPEPEQVGDSPNPTSATSGDTSPASDESELVGDSPNPTSATSGDTSPASDESELVADSRSAAPGTPDDTASASGVLGKTIKPRPRQATTDKPLVWIDPRPTPTKNGPQFDHLPDCRTARPTCNIDDLEPQPESHSLVSNQYIVLNEPIRFHADTARVLPASHELIREIATVIKDKDNHLERIVIEGHLLSDDPHASELTLKRARAVRDLLIKFGADIPIDAHGWGAMRSTSKEGNGIKFRVKSQGDRGYRESHRIFQCNDGSSEKVICRIHVNAIPMKK